jgi:hypothetical protein
MKKVKAFLACALLACFLYDVVVLSCKDTKS